jgi:phytoene dehydrogenase-like protein
VHVLVRHTGVVEELGLGECGLRYVDLDPWAVAPARDAAPIVLHRDLERTCAGLAEVVGERDADAYRRFVQDWTPRGEAVLAAFADRPSPARLARHLRRIPVRPAGSGGELARLFLQPGDALLDASFADERLRTALAWLGAQSGPPMHEAGTAGHLAWLPLLHRVPPGRAVGGSGALTDALLERLRRLGGTVRLGDGAAALTRSAGWVTGVGTSSGDHVAARAVVAACHVRTTADLLGDHPLAGRIRSATRVGPGIGMVVRVATSRPPSYEGGQAGTLGAMTLLARSRDQLRAAHSELLAGRAPSAPAVLAMTHTAVDPSVAPPGKHLTTLWAQWHPRQLSERRPWAAEGPRAADAVVDQVEQVAPGFRDSVEHLHVQTPEDLETELGLVGGNVMHLEMALDAMFALRPLPELSGYRTPLGGLYLSGASTHPGGGVSGASGRSAAKVVLRDKGRHRW